MSCASRSYTPCVATSRRRCVGWRARSRRWMPTSSRRRASGGKHTSRGPCFSRPEARTTTPAETRRGASIRPARARGRTRRRRLTPRLSEGWRCCVGNWNGLETPSTTGGNTCGGCGGTRLPPPEARRCRADAAMTSARWSRTVALTPAKTRCIHANGVYPPRSGPIVAALRSGAPRVRGGSGAQPTPRAASLVLSALAHTQIQVTQTRTTRARLTETRSAAEVSAEHTKTLPSLASRGPANAGAVDALGALRRSSLDRASSHSSYIDATFVEEEDAQLSFTESRSKSDQVSFHCLS